jgi:hypothetical protein
MSSDSETSSLYTIFSPSPIGKNIERRNLLFNPPRIIDFSNFDKLYHTYITIAMCGYFCFLNVFLFLLFQYTNIADIKHIDHNIINYCITWTVIQLCTSFFVVPDVLKIIISFENFYNYIVIHHVVHCLMAIVNIVFFLHIKCGVFLFCMWINAQSIVLFSVLINKLYKKYILSWQNDLSHFRH